MKSLGGTPLALNLKVFGLKVGPSISITLTYLPSLILTVKILLPPS